MSGPSPAQLARASQLLALADLAGARGPESAPTAASRVFDTLYTHLAPILGDAGVQLLFVRSAKLARGEFEHLAEAPILEGTAALRACLSSRDPAISAQSAALLFATFCGLITTFIGERLTLQVLRRAWPTLDETAPTETRD